MVQCRLLTQVISVATAVAITVGSMAGMLGSRPVAAEVAVPASAAYAPADAMVYVDLDLDVLSPQWLQTYVLLARLGFELSAETLFSTAAGMATGDEALDVAPFLGGSAALVLRNVDVDAATGGDGLGSITDLVTGAGDAADLGDAAADVDLGDAAALAGAGGFSIVLIPADLEGGEAAIAASMATETLETVEYEGIVVTGYEGDAITGESGMWYAVVDDAIVLGAIVDDVTAVIDVANGDQPSMADRPELEELLPLLPEERIAMGVLNGPALGATATDTGDEAGVPVALEINGFTAFTVSTESDGVRVQSRTVGVDGKPTAGTAPAFDPTIVERMPAGTALYTDGPSFAGTGLFDLVAGLLGALLMPADPGSRAAPATSADIFATLGMLLGIDLQGDFIDNLNGEYGFGLWGLDPMNPAGIGAALVATTDEPLAVGGVVAGLTTFVALGAQGAVAVTPTMIGGSLFSRIDLAGSGLPITVDLGVSDDAFVLGFGDGAEIVVEGPDASLAEDPRFVAAMEDMPAERNGLLYIDLGLLLTALGPATESGELAVGTLGALAVVGWVDGDYPAVTAFISIPEA